MISPESTRLRELQAEIERLSKQIDEKIEADAGSPKGERIFDEVIAELGYLLTARHQIREGRSSRHIDAAILQLCREIIERSEAG